MTKYRVLYTLLNDDQLKQFEFDTHEQLDEADIFERVVLNEHPNERAPLGLIADQPRGFRAPVMTLHHLKKRWKINVITYHIDDAEKPIYL